MKETKTRNSFRRAALPVFAMLIVAILSLTTVTYAWFTTGTKADVSEFEMTISAGGGLEIASESKGTDTVWSSTLDPSTIPNWATLRSKKLYPVSTTGKISAEAGKEMASADQVVLPFFTGSIVDSTPGAKLTKSSPATGEEYLSFSLYFRNTGDSVLNVNLGDTTVVPKEGTDYGHLAVRMAFVVFASAKVSVDNTVERSATLDSGVDAKIFEPNATSHTSAGINDYATHPTKSGEADNAHKFDTYPLVQEYSGEGIDRYNVEASTGVLAEIKTYEASETYFSLNAGEVTQVIVFLWIEGQDADCTNIISSNSFKTTLQFVAA